MTVEPSTEDKAHALRPLPSVSMALLPEQRRMRRMRRVAVSAIIAATVLGSAVVWTGGHLVPQAWAWWRDVLGFNSAMGTASASAMGVQTSTEPASALRGEDDEAGAGQAEPASMSLPNARFTTTFGRVFSFRQALLNAGLDVDECTQVEAALQHIVDFRRCRPEHTLTIERNEAGDLSRFEYHPSPTEFVEVTRNTEGKFRAEQIRMQVERAAVGRAGSVQTSLGDGLTVIGLPTGLATFFVEAFEGRINFASEARKGDVFRILVDEEKIDGKMFRYGRVHAVEYNGQKTGKMRAFYYTDADSVGQFYDETGRAMQGGWLRTPLRYDRVSSRFNPRRFHPILRRVLPHLGVDYAASSGTPVWAAAAGRVAFAGYKGPNGNLVVIRHPGGAETHYAHLRWIRRGIRSGARVKQRELIGGVGTTGRSTGPHLHFGLKKNGRLIDPFSELNGPGLRLAGKRLPAFKEQVAALNAGLDAIPNVPGLVVGADQPLAEIVDEAMD